MNLHRGNDTSEPAGISGGGTPVREASAGARKEPATDPATTETPDPPAPSAATPAPSAAAEAPSRTGSAPNQMKGHSGTGDARTAAGAAGTVAGADGAAGLNRRMERAVGGFVDDPRGAVREADAVLDEAARLLARRREELRRGWDGGGAGSGAGADTERLRIALTRYRDLTRQVIDLATAS